MRRFRARAPFHAVDVVQTLHGPHIERQVRGRLMQAARNRYTAKQRRDLIELVTTVARWLPR